MQIIKGGPRSGNYLQVIYELLAASGKSWTTVGVVGGKSAGGELDHAGMNLPGKTAEKRGLYEIRSDCANDRINLLPPP